MFDYRRYVPMRKGKCAGFPALGTLKSRDELTPWMEAVPSRGAAHRILYSLLSLTLLSALVAADTWGPAPQFTAKTLNGETFTNGSLSGSVVLLQFWTTWCPVCHRDQAAVDNIEAAFAGSGLVVLAIDDGEPEAVVRTYLQGNPRSCRVVVNDGRGLAARFGVHSYPHYVVIDRNGNIAASRSGGGGEEFLRYLLSRAGLSLNSNTPDTGNREAPAPASSGTPQWINVPGAQSTGAAKPVPKTIFVFANGERLEADHYVLRAGFLDVIVDGQHRKIPLSALDTKKTIEVNHELGIDLRIPTRGSELFLTF